MLHQRCGTVVWVALFCGLSSGCVRSLGGYSSAAPQTWPIYTSAPGGVIPTVPNPSSPIATEPIGSPGSGNPDGSGLSLQPAARTSAWLPAYRPGYPTTFAVPNATFGPQYATVGRTLDGRVISWGEAPNSRAANRPLKWSTPPGPRTEADTYRQASQTWTADAAARLRDLPATPQEDLKFRGGRTIRDLTYVNIYVGGPQAWKDGDRKHIDWALANAMSDSHLNHVLMQYFNDQPITSTYKGSFILNGYQPQHVTHVNVKELTRLLYQLGYFKGMPLNSTVVNYMLPSGVTLADPDPPTPGASPPAADAGSLAGLAGYHGSMRVGSATVYYAVGVYSERRANGAVNGIPLFDQPWKNVVATFYHQLQEARTDPDVDDAITTGQVQYAGWTSDNGQEVADYPVIADGSDGRLDQVFMEVPLANGSGIVPVQLMYSNAVHGPEGPIAQPHAGNPLPISPQIRLSADASAVSGTATLPPHGVDPELDMINEAWDTLPDSVKLQILRLVNGSQGGSSQF